MIQRFGQINSVRSKLRRKYAKKAHPEGNLLEILTSRLVDMPLFPFVLVRRSSSLSDLRLKIGRKSETYDICGPGMTIVSDKIERGRSNHVNQVVYPFSQKVEIIELLEEHITENIVKVCA